MSSGGDVGTPDPLPAAPSKPRLQSPLDYRNGDLVSRLLAATPPYLYNMPLVPHSFFFSEMLRSFVQAKAEPPGTARANAGMSSPVQQQRRSRKRAWRDMSCERGSSKPVPPPTNDKPLELTTTSRQPPAPPVPEEKLPPPANSPPVLPPPPPLLLPPCGLLPLPSPDTSLPPDMILPPPPPPLWYPPLYPLPPQPPYGIDPLHFFIDLRVSGHIWDRKLGKDAPGAGDGPLEEKPIPRPPSAGSTSGSSSTSVSSLVKQTKHCSAFSVPQPRIATERMPGPARAPTSTHYVLQNLARIYQDVRSTREQEAVSGDGGSEQGGSEGGEGKARCKDLRALIGLELVVDYVKHEGVPKRRPDTPEDAVPLVVDVLGHDKTPTPPAASTPEIETMRQL